MYEGLKGAAFLKAYFHDHGVTEEEIDQYWCWGGFMVRQDLTADEEGLAYAARRVKKIIDYRDMTVEDVLHDESVAPWFWPTAKHFEEMLYREPPDSNGVGACIISCYYKGNSYLFGIGKEEVEITEDMRKNGKWHIYTFSD